MNYSEAIQYIESLAPSKEKPSLRRISLFLAELGDPQNQFPSIHVGGTNGKGSTALATDALLRALGLKVGRFTGPHMFHWQERISINGQNIDKGEFASLALEISKLSEDFARKHPDIGRLSWFEFLTAMAFFKFKKESVDVAVLEVGLGGRFDATNAANNVIGTVITNIDLDHTHILGNSVEEIAFEKAGVMKANIPVVTGAAPVAFKELARQANLKGTKISHIDEIYRSKSSAFIQFADSILQDLSLTGPHQIVNAKLALACLSMTNRFSEAVVQEKTSALKQALANLYWPGRFQIDENNKLIMDVAHNPASAQVLRSTLDQHHCSNYLFVVGFFGSKDVEGFLNNLLRPGDRVIACDLNTKRRYHSAEKIAEICLGFDQNIEVSTAVSVQEGIQKALKISYSDQHVVSTGSFETVRETMRYLGWHPDSISTIQESNLTPAI